MTKSEAIAEMQKGVKITHRYFTKDEWMTIRNNKIVLEDGVICDPPLFWSYRTDSTWDSDYEIFKSN